ncbi:hypothetical protein I6G66_17285 [Delftia acidovorans]|uniref:Uncharacterized protein n=1 Tax=Delftia acidovorans TaxID=80866 RepID=A0A7T2RZK6_DELAC|nr:hypothetical protein [Delftia acidovorans]QPS06069.1 hypothetical protein I6G66_17285 [Delftia acidovorans]
MLRQVGVLLAIFALVFMIFFSTNNCIGRKVNQEQAMSLAQKNISHRGGGFSVDDVRLIKDGWVFILKKGDCVVDVLVDNCGKSDVVGVGVCSGDIAN